MSGVADLPTEILGVVESAMVSHFGTTSAAGVPIDTPAFCFPSDDLHTIGIATGLSYPAKAERARRNPKVGLLFEGGPKEPMIAVRGRAAVRDADLQSNALRYLAETGFEGVSSGFPWTEARKAIWYWTRIIVEVMPKQILWWDNLAATDGPPKIWNAPAGTAFPESDPSPPGKASSAPQWQQRSWQEMAAGALERGADAHLTLVDDQGYAMPVKARGLELVAGQFRLHMPKWLPWRGAGKATLTFEGIETFVGEAILEGDAIRLQVERALPEHPLIRNPIETIKPSPEVRSKLMGRLEEETRRRGQAIPAIPQDPPEPTRLAKLRQARIAISMA